MRKYILPVITIILISFISPSCFKDSCTRTYKIFTAVNKKLSALRNEVRSTAATSVVNPGKLYVKGNWIYLNEKDKGIHIIDNSNPAKPKNLAFINIPGNIDIAIKDNILYADLYCDVAAIDISNPSSVSVKKYLTKLFPERVNYISSNNPDSIDVTVDWTSRDTVMNCEMGAILNNCINCGTYYTASSTAPSTSSGVAGSMARFATMTDYMYAVSNSELKIININSPADPVFIKNQPIGWSIETIFPYKNKLFIGAGSSMSIYDVADPVNPVQISWAGHWCSGDPVVADDNFAYVTLHDADLCRNKVNELDIYDLDMASNARLRKIYPLTNPHGLSKDGDLLFICDGADGLKVFDVSDVFNMKAIKHFPAFNAYDVIALNNIAYVTASNGLYQYDYHDPANIHLLSKLAR